MYTALGILINSAENLVHCHFGNITATLPSSTFGSNEYIVDLPPYLGRSTIISMNQLRTFSLHLSEAGPRLLDHLVLTCLNDLTLMGIESSRAIDHVVSLIIRSACCVKRLKLLKFPLMDHTLVRLLRQTPELEGLEMKGWIWNDLWLNMTRETGTSRGSTILNPVVPRLKYFRLYGPRIFDLDVLQTMLNSRIMGGSEEFHSTDPDGEASRLRQVFLRLFNDDPEYYEGSMRRNGSWRNGPIEGNGRVVLDVRNARKPLVLDNKPVIQNTKAAADMVKNWGAALTDTLLQKREIDAENVRILDELLTTIESYNRTTEPFLGSSIIRKVLREIGQKDIPRDAEYDLKRRAKALARSIN
ncbi:hypothetical protein K435DRAFT_965892 [Dendrothele bispora CBS 962.96]|uniref:Uncharacterized protein n=1 Tax=Dendrothele bispora (strain CBS 962.96) TaxID=1314807 RepID=A0A4S8M3E9_DENBC|nr:hypothetical protein K435DRAFT_965892 [Dendrothele bispora CBS 962.96]